MAGGPLNPQYAPLYVAAGQQYGIPPQVLAGVADVETNGGANISTSSTGAQGLMQFEPYTAKPMGINPNDPRSAIFGAAKLLVQYGYHQNPTRAIGAYNGGPGNPQMGYAQAVMANAQRLAPALAKFMGAGGMARAKAGSVVNTSVPSTGSTTTSSSGGGTDYLSAGVDALMRAADKPINSSGKVSNDDVLGKLLGNVQSGLYNTPVTKTTTITAPKAGAAVKTIAQGKVAPSGGTGAYRFLPKGAPYTANRKDQGRDGVTTPGGPMLASGNGTVVGVLSDPTGFGPSYPVIHFTSGPDAGKTIYYGHTLATVRPGQSVVGGQVVSHTGTHGVGNATVPGWFELGYAPGGVPGHFGQNTPF